MKNSICFNIFAYNIIKKKQKEELKMYVYIIEYEGKVSLEGYKTELRAIKHLEEQGYKREIGWTYIDEKGYVAKIKEIKIV